jgi:3-dehydroquinate synthase
MPCAAATPGAQVALPDGEQHKDWAALNLIFDALLGHGADRKTTLCCPGRRCGGRHDRLCRRQLHARRALRAGADHAAGAGGFVGGRQDRHQPPAGQEHDRRLLPAAGGGVRPGHAGHAAPARAVSAGLAEVIKYGPIADMAFLDWIEAQSSTPCAPASRRRWRMPCGAAARSRPGWWGRTSASPAARHPELRPHLWPRHRSRPGLWRLAAWRGRGRGMVMAASCRTSWVWSTPPLCNAWPALIARAGLPTRGAVLDALDNAGRYLELMRVDKKAEARRNPLRAHRRPGPRRACAAQPRRAGARGDRRLRRVNSRQRGRRPLGDLPVL